MAVIVPGRGWSAAHQGTGASTAYAVLGPLAEGDYLARITVSAWATADAQLNLAFSLGPVDEASANALRNGVPLIARGVAMMDDIPTIDLFIQAFGSTWFWVPVGIKGEVGARYIVAGIAYRTAQAGYGVLIGASVLRFEREPRGMKPA